MDNELKHISLATTYEIDDSFDSDKFIKMRLRVCHDGKNPNNSYFELKDMKKAEDSIVNIPILANVIFDEDNNPQFGGHDIEIEPHKINEGEYKLIYKEVPIGLVPETNNYTIDQYNGKNYVFTDCFVWRNYSNYSEDIINRDKDIKLSMEITVDNYIYDSKNKCYQITDYRYTGITFLNKDFGTGMESALATTGTFSVNENKEKIIQMMQELQEALTQFQSSNLDKLEVDINKFSKEGGSDLEEKLALIEKYELTVDALNFSIDDLTLDDLEVKLIEFKASAEGSDEDKNVSGKDGEPDKPSDEFVLNGQIVDELIEKLSVEKIETEWGAYSKYSFVDFDTEKSEVYVWDRSDWKLYSFTFTRNGDTVDVDFESKKRCKVEIVPFDEGIDKDTTFELVVKEVVDSVVATKDQAYSTIKSEFDAYKETYKTPEADVDELRSFKSEKLEAERNAQLNEIFSKYEEKLADSEEFKLIRENVEDKSVEDVEKECALLFAQKELKFSAKTQANKNIRIPVHTPTHDEELYGGLFSVYRKTKTN